MTVVWSEIEDLINNEAEFLDSGRYEDWLDLYAEGGVYWVPRSHAQSDPLNEISLFYEGRALLEMRINRLQHPHAHSAAEPYRVSHVIGRVRKISVTEAGNEAHVEARFHIQEYHEGRERHFAGKYSHHLIKADGVWKIRLKRVDLVNCDATFEPIEVPL
ncbi:aromatic-ring-hydroxylating dioxygenase subunit beta [Govanella unica]|uniref:Aromatic-ring-hydroxylating dioxygenase subunit beta n=1 Tax=Govanella unica TaxID=2975056 RepID=A0A9X3TZS1_9PROT|nr:aromatic-ring-hydroxylating dioxygenase subunit beta [Govania unica]MDA5194990.1 aromatic-ring-hydroxylating dioxygenase subunit beta [Govania unica]